MMREISLLKSREEIYTMSDIWVFHVSGDAFISRHASFPMTKTGSKKKPGSKRVIANDTDSKFPGYCVVVVVVVSYSLMCTR